MTTACLVFPGLPTRSSSVTVSIQVASVNRNAPRITGPQNFLVQISENMDIGATVVRITASDPDPGEL